MAQEHVVEEFVADVQREVNKWLRTQQYSIIQLDLVRFFHDDDGHFAMLFNTYGWKSIQTDDGIDDFKSGWWTWICLKSDGSDVDNRSGVDAVVSDVYKKYVQRLHGASWVDEEARLYAK
jgi:hypothetical protein